MSAGYSVLWTEVAERDLREVIAFIAGDNAQNALHVMENIRDKASELYTFPERGRVVPELKSNGVFVYRELIISPWRLLYRIADSSNVYITEVLDSRRNVEEILLQRLFVS